MVKKTNLTPQPTESLAHGDEALGAAFEGGDDTFDQGVFEFGVEGDEGGFWDKGNGYGDAGDDEGDECYGGDEAIRQAEEELKFDFGSGDAEGAEEELKFDFGSGDAVVLEEGQEGHQKEHREEEQEEVNDDLNRAAESREERSERKQTAQVQDEKETLDEDPPWFDEDYPEREVAKWKAYCAGGGVEEAENLRLPCLRPSWTSTAPPPAPRPFFSACVNLFRWQPRLAQWRRRACRGSLALYPVPGGGRAHLVVREQQTYALRLSALLAPPAADTAVAVGAIPGAEPDESAGRAFAISDAQRGNPRLGAAGLLLLLRDFSNAPPTPHRGNAVYQGKWAVVCMLFPEEAAGTAQAARDAFLGQLRTPPLPPSAPPAALLPLEGAATDEAAEKREAERVQNMLLRTRPRQRPAEQPWGKPEEQDWNEKEAEEDEVKEEEQELNREEVEAAFAVQAKAELDAFPVGQLSPDPAPKAYASSPSSVTGHEELDKEEDVEECNEVNVGQVGEAQGVQGALLGAEEKEADKNTEAEVKESEATEAKSKAGEVKAENKRIAKKEELEELERELEAAARQERLKCATVQAATQADLAAASTRKKGEEAGKSSDGGLPGKHIQPSSRKLASQEAQFTAWTSAVALSVCLLAVLGRLPGLSHWLGIEPLDPAAAASTTLLRPSSAAASVTAAQGGLLLALASQLFVQLGSSSSTPTRAPAPLSPLPAASVVNPRVPHIASCARALASTGRLFLWLALLRTGLVAIDVGSEGSFIWAAALAAVALLNVAAAVLALLEPRSTAPRLQPLAVSLPAKTDHPASPPQTSIATKRSKNQRRKRNKQQKQQQRGVEPVKSKEVTSAAMPATSNKAKGYSNFGPAMSVTVARLEAWVDVAHFPVLALLLLTSSPLFVYVVPMSQRNKHFQDTHTYTHRHTCTHTQTH